MQARLRKRGKNGSYFMFISLNFLINLNFVSMYVGITVPTAMYLSEA